MAGKLSAFFGAQDMTVGNPATKSHSVFHTASHRQLGAAAVQHGGLHRGRQLCG
mgnify:CR=1 FL=1